jgi:hypothetical protein
MTPEQVDRAIAFLIEQSAKFFVGMEELKLRQEESARRHERDYEHLKKALTDLTQQTARFESWAAEVIAIQSRRLDQHDRILDRLPPMGQ